MMEIESEKNRASRAILWRSLSRDALLVSVTIIWGGTFLFVQNTLKLVGPFTFLAMRFTIATLVLVLIFRTRLMRLTRSAVLQGGVIGLFLFAAYALQTTGLQYTTSSKAAFITGLYVPFVPLLVIVLLRQWPARSTLIGVALSLAGLILLAIKSSTRLEIGWGELLILGCALANALHIVSVGKFAPRADAINLAIVQIALVALLSLLAIPLSGEPYRLPPLPAWGAALVMGVVATAFCLVVMNRVQQFVSSTRATLIYALEPVWAGLLGYLAGESLTLSAGIGCCCILLGMIVCEIRFSLLKKLPPTR